MYPFNAVMAGFLSACFWYLPEVNYWERALADVLRNERLPNIPGI